MKRQSTKVKADELQDLILNRITKLRPKLLDLSRRNPLISTTLGTRSNSIVRVVDELPDDLAVSIGGGSKMRFLPLPALDEDPRDEKTKVFQTALSQARHTDEVFLAAMESLDPKSDKAIEEGRRIDRALRDRLRDQLSMPPRQQGKDVSLSQHAINNGIAPSYELPKPEDAHQDGRHEDENIQTLFLPEDLERKLNALTTKCKSWAQETGINVLQAAFGFLEWTEPNKTDSAFAPLVLLPVEIEKKKTSAGLEFWVGSAGEEPQTNLVLAEKLRIDFGIALPPYEGGPLEDYFEKVAAVSPKIIKWKVRRQAAFGVFPSARMAMYNDLAVGKHDFENSEIISSLFGGAGASGATPFADDYEVDKPEVENKVPALVLDADSSQFSTIVDIAHGKNLAVEGPPGTGKSQTIVNTIAAAIGEGKKVLFIAEKTAALNVVKSRLEAVGLGEFLLPLQAERSNRKLISQSMKERLEMQAGPSPAEYASKIDWFKKTRAQLAEYVEVIGKPYGSTGLSVYAVIGKSLVGNQLLAGLPQELQRANIKSIETFDQTRIAELCATADAAEKAWRDAQDAKSYWSGLNVAYADKFKVDELCNLAKDAADAYSRTAKARTSLSAISLDEETDLARLARLSSLLSPLNEKMPTLDRDLLIRMCKQPQFSLLKGFLEKCAAAQKASVELARTVADQADRDMPKRLRAARALCEDCAMDTLSVPAWREHAESRQRLLDAQRQLFSQVQPVIKELPQFGSLGLAQLLRAGTIVREAGRRVLSLRVPSHADAATSVLLQQLCTRGVQLSSQRERVRGSFAILPDLSAAELLEHARNIRGAGFFARFGKNFQTAKKVYVSHASKKFDRALAASELQAAAELRSVTTEFQSDPQAHAVFGIHFKGADTDFESFTALSKYYEAIDSEFSGVALKELRSFLKSADLDSLLLLSELPDQKPAGSFEDLARAIPESEASLDKVRQGTGKIGSLSVGLSNPDRCEVAELEKLSYALEANQRLCSELDGDEAVKGLLGAKWKGWETNPDSVVAELGIATEIRSEGGFSGLLTAWLEQGRLQDAQTLVFDVLRQEDGALTATHALSRLSGVDFRKQVEGKRASDCASHLSAVAADRDGIQFHSIYCTQKEELQRHGFDWVLRALLESGRSLEGLSAKLEAVIFRSMAIAVYATYGAILSKYPGDRLDTYRAQLAKLDRDIIRLSRQHLRKKIHSAARPPAGNGQGRKSTWTQLALIENEANKVQGHISLRELNERAGDALRELKPCWMMSPLAVAQYLPSNKVMFDLCIIDEASQMPPEDAIGALSRCKQAMIVGDTNQLPPTSFFRKMLEDDDVDEDEAVSEESILEMANATFRPARRLRWHYRSRHSGLIAFSNEHVYDRGLVVFPSATEDRKDMGVSLVRVDGRYKTGVNPPEATAMVEAAIEFMKTNPDRSLGIVTLNQKQRDLLQEEMDSALARDAKAAAYVEKWLAQHDGLEEFFIKNLENVQGDERDVIFIGTVYGAEAPGGPVMQRFGPINGVAGKRRLNVLFSRAKQQIVTFSSMTAADITADENGNVGAYMLKRWLEYSASGVIHAGDDTGREPDSEFEVYVIDQLRAMGCTAVPQVGVHGFFIDIGVKHPAWPHGFIMAVECDGATYHSSKSARDRDRLRQEVLEGLGWHFHRIWSTDWFNDAAKEGQRLRAAVEARLKQLGVHAH